MLERIRGCGFRKLGATYVVGGQLTAPCGRLPYFVHACPTCGGGIRQSRGWTWVEPEKLLGDAPCRHRVVESASGIHHGCGTCVMADPGLMADDKGRCGLLWIGSGFYPTSESFVAEAASQGICRRIVQVPRGFKAGQTWVLLAHPKVRDPHGHREPAPAIFAAFLATAIEQMVTAEEFQNDEEVDSLRKRGINPVVLPDIPQHRGSVYDDTPQIDIEE